MNPTTRVVRETGTFRPLPNDGGTGNRILCLTDVAAWLMCSVEEARDFLVHARVPCLRLPRGSQRFLLSTILSAVRMRQEPFECEMKPIDFEAAGDDGIARAWEHWALENGDRATSIQSEDWSAWIELMVNLGETPDGYFALPKADRRKLVESIRKHPNSLNFADDGCETGNQPTHKTHMTTTRALGSFLGRKVFER